MALPDIEDNGFYPKLSSIFQNQLNISLSEVIIAAENDGIFEKMVMFLKQLQK